MNKCETEGIEPDTKYKSKRSELKQRYEQEDAQGRKVNQHTEPTLNSQINRKIAKTWVVNKLIYQGKGTESVNQSQIVNHLFNEESILEEYETNKQRYLVEPNERNEREPPRQAISNFHKRQQSKTKNRNESH